MTREHDRIEPLLSAACSRREIRNHRDGLLDLTPVETVPCRYSTAAGWIVFGFLVVWILMEVLG
jgi:hypothetical protein